MKTQKLPEYVQQYIQKYAKLQLGKEGVACPYYINLKRSKDLRAMIGKGTPEEIELEAKMWEKLKGVSFNNMTPKEIKEFLVNRGIGIDCSGFIVHIINHWHEHEYNKPIWSGFKLPKKSLLSKIAYKFKPVEQLSANIISNAENADPISIKEVLPGDVIRLKWKKRNSHHIVFITEVDRNDKNEVTRIEYVQSIRKYGDDSGVKTGEIRIIDQTKPLEEQEWLEVDKYGVNHLYEGYLVELHDNGLRRFKALAPLQQA